MRNQSIIYGIIAALLFPLLATDTSRSSEDAQANKAVLSTLHAPSTEGENDYYVANRAPLLPNPLIKLPVGAVKADGWLRRQLVLMREGMFGRLPELSKFCQANVSAWMSPRGEGDFGWEELPYWLKGYGDLGYLLEDRRIIDETKTWIEAVIAGQEEDGWFGPRLNKKKRDVWPNMVMLDALRSYYEFSQDERVIQLMTRYFRWQLELPREQFLPGSWQKIRGGDNLHSIYWLFNRTGEMWLLDLARKNHELTADWTAGIASWHGVNITQCFREPAQFFQQSKAAIHLQAVERNYQAVMELFGQAPGGMFGADENCRSGYTDPRQAAESCSMVEFMRSNEILLAITGNPQYSDRCEEIAFNSLPAAMTPDLKGLHYLTAPNMPQLDSNNKSPGLQNSGCMLTYSPWRYRCCQHNVAQGWPYFTEHVWMAVRGNGLAATLYAPSQVEARVGDGATVRIVEETDYPFGETIDFSISLSKPTAFPLLLRIPGWCFGAKISINDNLAADLLHPSSFIALEKEWRDGDHVKLELPMAIHIKRWPKSMNAVSVERGPLTYSLKIGERWEITGGAEAWPEQEVYPTTAWNYGLDRNENRSQFQFSLHKKEGPLAEHPFTLENAPLEIRTFGRKIPNWKLTGGLVGRLQPSPALSTEPREEITLIPMGCARLRITAFPVVSDGTDAIAWLELPPPLSITASHVGGDLDAVNDGEYPETPEEKAISLFSWQPHRGTDEWIAYRFETPRRISHAVILWAVDDEENGCRVPEHCRIVGKDGAELQEMGRYGDGLTRIAFSPVFTDEIRLEVKLRDGYLAGIYEWLVGD
ncbi:MAG: transcriptional initiation protein Tat [Candidatus Omnitrophota bacterium]|jgi:hypothetical protein|nr:MAG: transcriptional initiation protein Tat [Candidatus Omnitrophota bacterium]